MAGIEDFGGNIVQKGADPTGVKDSTAAIVAAMGVDSDIIFIPKGVYTVNKNITIPANKRLTFGNNARLRPAKGITFTVNCSIDAGTHDWIFDITAGGLFNGAPKIDYVYPHWFGAKGDKTTDDTAAFQSALLFCNYSYKLFLPLGEYRIRQTLVSYCRGIESATGPYVDGGQFGAILQWDPLDTQTDLLPCLKIQSAGIDAVFENFTIHGMVQYNRRYLTKWIKKELFDQDLYEMFAVGVAAIEIASTATPVFRNIRTRFVKVGQLLNNDTGHITSHDCNWGGLIGVYCRKNNGDYFYQGGSISGEFCGILLGTLLIAGHRGGIGAQISRVHMGFSPYGIYQCIDSGLADYNSVNDVGGLSGIFMSAQFEQCGEAAIRLLPKSITGNLMTFGFGFSWSRPDYTDNENDWQYALPDDLKPLAEKQKYAAWFGALQTTVVFGDTLNTLSKSSNKGALGSAYIYRISNITGQLDLTGLALSDVVIREKVAPYYTSNDLKSRMAERDTRSFVPIAPANLLKNPEILENWTVGNGGKLSLASPSEIPVPVTDEMKRIIGTNIKIIKLTPDGVNEPSLQIDFDSPSLPVDVGINRPLAMQYFVLPTAPTNYTNYASLGKIVGKGIDIYGDVIGWERLGWKRMLGREQGIPTGLAYRMSFHFLSKTSPTYFAGIMASYDLVSSYSPVPHLYADKNLEIGGAAGNGLILTDAASGIRYQLIVNNGVLALKAL
ncbi:hypothetical protein [Paenibacillus sp. NPDC058174]|uniref:hypothetical protein n=1 Tax=Paenibacillus sp. NPDC058174 TaxID=3346366 RepID=UPI0036D92337